MKIDHFKKGRNGKAKVDEAEAHLVGSVNYNHNSVNYNHDDIYHNSVNYNHDVATLKHDE